MENLRNWRPGRAIAYGGDYNPEQWDSGVIDEDLALMGRAGVNFVTLGVFAWSRLEPQAGHYDLDWLEELMGRLHRQGIGVDLATATASPPAWLVQKYPQILPVQDDGTRMRHGSRQHFCPSSPEFRVAATALTRQLALRLGAHPALRLWHVGNEYGCHIRSCYCQRCQEAFRGWLRARYHNIAALNQAWGTRVWSQFYSDFGQIEPPASLATFASPGHLADWRRFFNDALLECFLSEATVLRAYTPQIPVTTNFMGPFPFLDYAQWALHLDVVSDDSYPDPANPASAATVAFGADLMRALGAEASFGRVWRSGRPSLRPGDIGVGGGDSDAGRAGDKGEGSVGQGGACLDASGAVGDTTVGGKVPGGGVSGGAIDLEKLKIAVAAAREVEAAAETQMRACETGGAPEPFILMEQTPSAVQWRGRNSGKRPGQFALWSWSRLARGADAILQFQWRQASAGAETFHSGMVPHAGPDSRIFAEVCALGTQLARLDTAGFSPETAEAAGAVAGEMAGEAGSSAGARAGAALVMDWDSWWTREAACGPVDSSAFAALRAWHRTFFEAGMPVDIVRPYHDLSAYSLIIVPEMWACPPGLGQALETAARAGAQVLVCSPADITDACGRAVLGGYGAKLQALTGVRVVEQYPSSAPFEPSDDITLPAGENIAGVFATDFITAVALAPAGEQGMPLEVQSPELARTLKLLADNIRAVQVDGTDGGADTDGTDGAANAGERGRVDCVPAPSASNSNTGGPVDPSLAPAFSLELAGQLWAEDIKLVTPDKADSFADTVADTPAYAGKAESGVDTEADTPAESGVEVLATFAPAGACRDLAGKPALTRRSLPASTGAGWYLATDLNRQSRAALLRLLAAHARLKVDLAPAGVEQIRRGGLKFYLNHSDRTVQVPGVVGVDLLSGARATGMLVLAPRSSAVLQA